MIDHGVVVSDSSLDVEAMAESSNREMNNKANKIDILSPITI